MIVGDMPGLLYAYTLIGMSTTSPSTSNINISISLWILTVSSKDVGHKGIAVGTCRPATGKRCEAFPFPDSAPLFHCENNVPLKDMLTVHCLWVGLHKVSNLEIRIQSKVLDIGQELFQETITSKGLLMSSLGGVGSLPEVPSRPPPRRGSFPADSKHHRLPTLHPVSR